jgi:uncharacterized membrane protein (UPF0127 family)
MRLPYAFSGMIQSILISSQRKGLSTLSGVVIAAIVVIAVLATLVYFSMNLEYGSTTNFSTTANSNTIQTSLISTRSLSGFGVESLDIVNSSTNSTIVRGFAYTALSASQQEEGFQNVTSFGDCDGFATSEAPCLGMIFIFSSEQTWCFWMHNTPIPLQQIWISSSGRILAIYQAQPESDQNACYSGQSVLEASPSLELAIGEHVYQSANL